MNNAETQKILKDKVICLASKYKWLEPEVYNVLLSFHDPSRQKVSLATVELAQEADNHQCVEKGDNDEPLIEKAKYSDRDFLKSREEFSSPNNQSCVEELNPILSEHPLPNSTPIKFEDQKTERSNENDEICSATPTLFERGKSLEFCNENESGLSNMDEGLRDMDSMALNTEFINSTQTEILPEASPCTPHSSTVILVTQTPFVTTERRRKARIDFHSFSPILDQNPSFSYNLEHDPATDLSEKANLALLHLKTDSGIRRVEKDEDLINQDCLTMNPITLRDKARDSPLVSTSSIISKLDYDNSIIESHDNTTCAEDFDAVSSVVTPFKNEEKGMKTQFHTNLDSIRRPLKTNFSFDPLLKQRFDLSDADDDLEDLFNSLKIQKSQSVNVAPIPNPTSIVIEEDRYDNFIACDSEGEDQDPSAEASISVDLSSKSFKRKREALSKHWFAKFNNQIFNQALPTDLLLTWSKTLYKTAGRTILCRKRINNPSSNETEIEWTSSIELSCKVVDDESKLKNTLCHEMIHAVCFIVHHQSKPPHGALFKQYARLAEMKFSELHISTRHHYEIQYKYKYRCTLSSCAQEIGRHSKSLDLSSARCAWCGSNIELLQSDKGRPPQPPSKFLAFVKEHEKRVAAQFGHTLTRQALMKELGIQYQAFKSSQS